MIQINGEHYELKYTIRTLEQIEAALGKGVMTTIRQAGAFLGMVELKTLFGFALFSEDGKKISPKQGMQICEDLMIEEGYNKVNELVITTMGKDLPFLFQVD